MSLPFHSNVSLKPSSYLFTMQEKPECIISTLLWHLPTSKTFSWVSPNYLWFNNQCNSIISVLNNERLKFGSKFPRSAFPISESANYCTPEIPEVHWCINKLVPSAVNSTMKCLSSGVDRKGPFLFFPVRLFPVLHHPLFVGRAGMSQQHSSSGTVLIKIFNGEVWTNQRLRQLKIIHE